ncbi:16S rRNA (adenine(1518)-N(6)/adenine(1519)-N(6))-dimethyltransferase RsmA [Nocardioides sp. GY 10127]|uniref:16S rRNA (adenine(1518)-N(6)/adenine(1519)-N(6))- dimethyltransferase RsmA n=1 Tax=Nocardioides sp. GY 10127 TaxID=2569762 RepID=UPI0010A8B37A|nr:16S rRNA (adenine(1518)-N(6)/adenine(1519)-N(6))-dimethyltransferase RsmA [Nocardioides sp. GY 10127]
MTDTSAGPSLLGPAEVRQLADELDLRPTKQRGQNFVIDPNTVRRIVRESGVGADDVVVEVGPGLGSLTLALLEVVGRVVAIELDDVLAGRLPRTIAERAPGREDDVVVVLSDALRVTELPGPAPTALVANLPYNVSVPVLLHLLALLPSLERGLVMVQAEVADRLAARPGSKVYGVPSVKAAWFADVRRAGAIGRNVFWPAPNVDSGLVAWERRDPPLGPSGSPVEREAVFAVVDAAFAQRRKALRGALRALAPAEQVDAALAAAGVDPLARGESLVVEDFVAVAEALVGTGWSATARSGKARRAARDEGRDKAAQDKAAQDGAPQDKHSQEKSPGSPGEENA